MHHITNLILTLWTATNISTSIFCCKCAMLNAILHFSGITSPLLHIWDSASCPWEGLWGEAEGRKCGNYHRNHHIAVAFRPRPRGHTYGTQMSPPGKTAFWFSEHLQMQLTLRHSVGCAALPLPWIKHKKMVLITPATSLTLISSSKPVYSTAAEQELWLLLL